MAIVLKRFETPATDSTVSEHAGPEIPLENLLCHPPAKHPNDWWKKLKIAKDFDDTENANHAVKVFEAQIINETLHDHVGWALAIGDEQFQIVVPQDGLVPIDGVNGHLGS